MCIIDISFNSLLLDNLITQIDLNSFSAVALKLTQIGLVYGLGYYNRQFAGSRHRGSGSSKI